MKCTIFIAFQIFAIIFLSQISFAPAEYCNNSDSFQASDVTYNSQIVKASHSEDSDCCDDPNSCLCHHVNYSVFTDSIEFIAISKRVFFPFYSRAPSLIFLSELRRPPIS